MTYVDPSFEPLYLIIVDRQTLGRGVHQRHKKTNYGCCKSLYISMRLSANLDI